MNFQNFFEDKANREALSMYTKAQRRAMGKACNDKDYMKRLKLSLSKATKLRLGGVNICTMSSRYHQTIVGRELHPVVDMDVSTFFTTINGKPWILINSDVPLMEVTVIHEAIHLDQFLRGDLHFVEGGTVWKGTLYPKALIDKTTTPEQIMYQWRSLPWELEAYALQFSDEQCRHLFEHGEEQTVSDLREVLGLYGRVIPPAPEKPVEVAVVDGEGDVTTAEVPESIAETMEGDSDVNTNQESE